jgi:hypothetical protein
MKKLLALLMLLFSIPAFAGDLPPGYTYRVLNNTPGTWQTFTFTFTPTQTGTQYIMFAFRQDPAYWRMDNVTVTAPGNSTNLATNGNMATGGSLTVNTSNYGQMSINAPTAWGVSYQAGVYPSAAGTWMNGMWYDGAVGSYDGIYQGLNLTAGVTYTVSFQVNGDHSATTTTSGWQLAVYTGSCAQTSLDPTQCQMPTSSGFQTVAAPGQTYSTGCGNNCPPPPAPPEPTYPTTSISSAQAGKIAQTSALTKNSVYIQNYGLFTNVTIEQSGNYNAVRGINGAQSALINGNYNTIVVKQGTPTVSGYNNLAEISVTGGYNSLNIDQRNNGKYTEVSVNGSSNSLTLQQKDGTTKSAFVSVTGNSNSLNILQQGTGQHFLDIIAPTSGNTITVNQSGAAQKLFSLSINSPNVGVTVTQNNATTGDSAAMSITCNTGPCNGYSYTRN